MRKGPGSHREIQREWRPFRLDVGLGVAKLQVSWAATVLPTSQRVSAGTFGPLHRSSSTLDSPLPQALGQDRDSPPQTVTDLTLSPRHVIVTDMTRTEIATRAFAEELERLEHRGELELEDPERAGRRGALIVAAGSLWARHLGGLLDAEQTRRLLGVKSRQAVHDLVRRGRLLRVKDSAGHVLYPANQFDRHGRPSRSSGG